MIVTGENSTSLRETCASATLSTSSHTELYLKIPVVPRSKQLKPAGSRSNHYATKG